MSKPLEESKSSRSRRKSRDRRVAGFADMGADVVKVENKETGDLSRWMLTALIGGPDVKNATVSHYFIAMNRGKRSITADLKKRDAIEMVRRMIKSYDVLVTTTGPVCSTGWVWATTTCARSTRASCTHREVRGGPRGPWVTRAESRHARAGRASGVMARRGCRPILRWRPECSLRITRVR